MLACDPVRSSPRKRGPSSSWIPAGVYPRESGGGNERSFNATRCLKKARPPRDGRSQRCFQAAAKPVKLASSKCITRNRKATHHDHLHVQSLGSGLRAIPHQPVGGPRQGGGLRRGEEGRAGGAAQHAARARHVSAGAAGGRPAPPHPPPP